MKNYIITPMIGIGDVLMTTPAIEVLKKHQPDSKITFCTMNKSTFEILRGNPFIDKLIYYPFLGNSKLSTLWKFIKEQSGRYTTNINFYPSNRYHYNLVSLLTFSPKRIGHKYLRMNLSQLNWIKNRTLLEDDTLHCVEENIRLLQLLKINLAEKDIPPMKVYLTPEEIEQGNIFCKSVAPLKCCIGVHAGTSTLKGQASRRWPKEKFVKLINTIKNAHFLLFGTDEEKEVNQFVFENTEQGKVTLVNNKSLREVASIIHSCNFFLSNDSGLMHLAAAVDKPVIAIVGPTNPVYIKPWHVKHAVVTAPVPCLHCFRYSPKPLTCSYKEQFLCISGISVEMVEFEVVKFMEVFCLK